MDVYNNVLKYFFGTGLEPYQGVDFKKELPTIHGGVLLWDIINLMKNKIVCAQTHQLSADTVSSQCDWVNKLKYFAYSAVSVHLYLSYIIHLARFNYCRTFVNIRLSRD